MAKSNPRRPDPPRDEAGIGDPADLADPNGAALRDARPVSGRDNFLVGRRGEFLDTELDDVAGDLGFGGRSFADDVRSDAYDDERRERR